MHGNSGSKIGVDAGGPVVTADTRNFTPDPVREKACIEHLKKTIPRVMITYLDFYYFKFFKM
jgi:sarcosine oxidase